MKKLAILTGAGISAESGLSTFRGEGGLWAGHDVTEVASPEGWAKDKAMVLEFYNQRRKAARRNARLTKTQPVYHSLPDHQGWYNHR